MRTKGSHYSGGRQRLPEDRQVPSTSMKDRELSLYMNLCKNVLLVYHLFHLTCSLKHCNDNLLQ